ncbi:MAG: glycosyltransferase family 1 protein [Patescibacteria group bacterium]|jgi:glycosyltransferase involved in cell wall biosynthesis
MIIGVDIRVLMDKYYSGVSEYAANLLKAILAVDKTNDYKLFYNSYSNPEEKLKLWNRENAQVIGTHIPNKIFNYIFQKIFRYPKLDRVLGGADIFWSPHFNFTRLSGPTSGLKKIITVHDLSFLRYPEFFNVRKNFWHRALAVKSVLLAAEAIIAVSENTKNDIMELTGVKSEKIKVIYSGNNLVKREVSEAEKKEFLIKNGLSGRLILYLGNIEPRKNIAGLIAAFNLLRSQDAQLAGEDGNRLTDVKLVLAGASGWKNRRIYEAWQKSPYKNDIKFLGYIDKTDQAVLYSLSSVLVYPSYYEGFGFPPLEAMTYGLPVVCSNNSSLPEVVGNAALMINPFKVEEIADALKIILTDDGLRQHLIARGLEQAKNFSWEKAAKEYLQVFRDVYEDK